MPTITLSLISHTNAGKTTLARTLLRRDVGEVRFGAHVTLQNTPYPLIDTEEAHLCCGTLRDLVIRRDC